MTIPEPEYYHAQKYLGEGAECGAEDIAPGHLVPYHEILEPEGRYFNCPACYQKMHGRGRPNPPEVP